MDRVVSAEVFDEGAIVMGYDGETFGPNDPVTREQMVTMFYRYAQFAGYNTSAAAELTIFHDGEQTAEWAQEAMKWAIAVELIKGTGNDTLSPQGNATRAQVATVLMRFDKDILLRE